MRHFAGRSKETRGVDETDTHPNRLRIREYLATPTRLAVRTLITFGPLAYGLWILNEGIKNPKIEGAFEFGALVTMLGAIVMCLSINARD